MSGKISNKIVTDGLVLYLDAANTRSYVTGDTVWNDLTFNPKNATILNGLTYSSLNTGVLIFDGVNDYCNIPSNSAFAYGTGDFTWEIWLNATSLLGGNNYPLDHGSNGGTIAWQAAGIGHSIAGVRYYNSTNGTSGNLYMPGFGTSSVYVTNTWFQLVASRTSGITSLYTNGLLSATGSDSHNYTSQELNIGKYGGGPSPIWNGKISNVKIYKGKGLTSTEVLQNYNALKSRFGL